MGGEVPRNGPSPDRRQPLRLVPCRQRRRGPAPQAGPRGAGQAAAGLGVGDLDHHPDRPGDGQAELSRPRHVLRPARLLVVGSPGGLEDQADGPGPGRAGTLAQPGAGDQGVGRPGGDRQRTPEPEEPPGVSEAPGAARPDPPPARRRGRPEHRVRRAVRRPRRPPEPGPGHRLGQVRWPGERPLQPQDRGDPQGARTVFDRAGLRGREHDGRRRRGRTRGLPDGSGQPSSAPTGPGPPPPRAVRAGRLVAEQPGGAGRPSERVRRPRSPSSPSGEARR